MFGYIKPCKAELRMKEYDAYRAVYCGLCRQMGKDFGPLARLALSYDFTFLCMLLYGVRGGRPEIKMRRCCVNPMKKVPACEPDEPLRYSADIAILMIYYKLLDNIQDNGIFGKIGWSIPLPAAMWAYKKAAASRPSEGAAIARSIEKQRDIELGSKGSVDEAAEPTAAVMAEIFAGISEDQGQKRVLERLGYLIGRYVYICDAADDMKADLKKGRYNPYVIKYLQDKNYAGAMRAARESARESLFMTVGEVGRAYDLLDVSEFGPVMENIVYMGLRQVAEQILSEKGGAPVE